MSHHESPPKNAKIPVPPVERWLVPVKHFLHIEATSGLVLVACTLLALLIANSPWSHAIESFWHTPVSIEIGHFKIEGDLGHLVINDILMTIFFFVVGLEVKREIVAGELRDPRKALLPVFGAIGGVVTPAAIYTAMQWAQPGQRGWAIPMATDIAFVVGILALFGSRVPFGLKIFLLTLAIVDDIIAVLVIAIVFTETISWGYILAALAGFALVYLLNKIGVRSIAIYVMVGIAIWIAFHHAGIHPTIAGVLLGLMTPSRPWIGNRTFVEILSDTWDDLRGADPETEHLPVNLEQLQFIARESHSPLHRLEMGLHPWVAYLVMPIFALANAGVELETSSLSNSVAIAVAVALFVGKPLGILLFCYIAIALRFTRLPAGVSWPVFFGGACLGGIGFTMSLFLNALSFPTDEFPELEAAGKFGTLLGSLVSTILGSILLLVFLKPNRSLVANRYPKETRGAEITIPKDSPIG